MLNMGKIWNVYQFFIVKILCGKTLIFRKDLKFMHFK